MEMELNKQKIEFYSGVYESCIVHEASGEHIIPDTSPDMMRIITSNGKCCVKNKETNAGNIVVSGVVEGCVLYVAEGEKNVRKLDVNIPFSHRFESSEITKDMPCVISSELITLEAREINSRKIALRAQIAIDAKCYAIKHMGITQEIENENEYSVKVKTGTVDMYLPCMIRERSFTIIDDMEIPKTIPDFETMLESSVALDCTDMKIIGNKAIFKGIATIKSTYISNDGTLNVMTQNLPYSQIMDVDEFEEECDLELKMSIRACDINAAHDMTGDARYISVNILVDTILTVHLKKQIPAVEDLYSTSYALSPQFEDVTIQRLCSKENKRVTVNEKVETANTVKRILDAKVILEPMRRNVDKLQNNAQIQIVYTDDNDQIYSVHRKCGVLCDLMSEDRQKIICDLSVAGINATGRENQITVQFFVDYDIKVIGEDRIRNLKKLSCGERFTNKSDEATVIVKHIYTEQPLWNIAKKYNTTVEEIAAANCLESFENAAAGSVLLIPCGK
ncbi:MAG: DUF3794 domain-containing protein [Clostridia bacterium]|nr:DUF3794 domain-containing protein [Clostridia bacterium]